MNLRELNAWFGIRFLDGDDSICVLRPLICSISVYELVGIFGWSLGGLG